MMTRNRLLALKKWTYETLCRGRVMKAPAPGSDITKIVRAEPKVYLAWYPTRPEGLKSYLMDPEFSCCPGILICPSVGNVKSLEEKRFDTYKHVARPQEMGQWLNVSILFSVYEPGIRLPGFVDSAEDKNGMDMSLILEGSEEGLFTLTDWMDECMNALTAGKIIPGSDLFVEDMSLEYGPYMEGGYVSDKRPLFYGFINAKFQCHANDKGNGSIDSLLE